MTLRFLHAADLHLGSPLSGLSARDPAIGALFEDASRRAFRAVIDLALERKVDAVLIAGDVFDRDWKDFSVGQGFVREIARLTRAGIRLAMIRGNHDAESMISRQLPLPDGVAWLGADRPGTLDWPEISLAVHGMSFKDRSVPEALVHRYPAPARGRFNVGLLHTSLAGSAGHDRYAPCTVADLAGRGYDYWALGHVHTRAVVGKAGPVVVFPGNIQGRSIRETGPRGVTLVTVEGSVVTGLEALAVDAARWAEADVDVSGLDDADGLARRIEAALVGAGDAADGRPLAVRLRLVGERPALTLADGVELREIAQAAAARLSERILVEKVVQRLEAPKSGPASPIPDLDDALAAVGRDPTYAAGLDADLDLLLTKLPAPGAALLDRDRDLLASNARALLLARLETG